MYCSEGNARTVDKLAQIATRTLSGDYIKSVAIMETAKKRRKNIYHDTKVSEYAFTDAIEVGDVLSAILLQEDESLLEIRRDATVDKPQTRPPLTCLQNVLD